MTEDVDPITLSVEIDPAEFDEPRQLMWERLIEEYGQETDRPGDADRCRNYHKTTTHDTI